MQKIYLEEIPFLVETKKLSYRDATYIIWEKLYSKPKQFGLNDFTEDELSDFLISFIEKIETILENFLKNRSPISFQNYIKKCIINSKQSWFRKKIIKKVNDQSIESFSQNESEEDIHKYEIKETCETSVNERRKFQETPPRKHKHVAEMAALVLTMKACQDVNDSLIEKVAGFTGFEKDFIYDKVQELKEKNNEKRKRRELLIRRRDNSFYFRRRYQIEMSRVEEGTKTQNLLEEKFNMHGKNWEKNNEILTRTSSASPSAEQIAVTLGIRPRQVRFYISHIKQPENAEKIKDMVKKSEALKNDAPENNTGGDIAQKPDVSDAM
ncbi:MAG: hypothetical protein IJP61_09635 [Treponema sp.]|nr:hypothetical protein [Treponema sp.]